MKLALLLPLAFFAGIDGFVLFAVYALFCAIILYLARRARAAQALVPVPVVGFVPNLRSEADEFFTAGS